MKMVLKLDEDPVPTCRTSGNYCCEKMKAVMESNHYGLHYNAQLAQTLCDRRDRYISWHWNYCPFCGKNIKAKYRQYKKVLKDEFGITDPSGENVEEKLPPEFKTDEWWKKRGL